MRREPDFSRLRVIEDGLEEDRLLKPPEAASMLGVAVGTLAWWRTRSHAGPDFIRVGGHQGHIRYSLKALRNYVTGRTEKPQKE